MAPRFRTVFRLVIFSIAIKIISNYNKREWGWLNEENVDDLLDIRIYTVYSIDEPENDVGYVTFDDFGIDPNEEMYHTQKLRKLIKRIGENYRKIVLNPVGSKKSSKSETSLSSLFMRELVHENLNRSYEGLPKIEIYYYAS